MPRVLDLAGRQVGDGCAVFIIAEIGINHNGELDIARRLIDVAVKSGADAVKFQKRDPELCVPVDQRERLRETPWGTMTYMDYRYRVELSGTAFDEIDRYCRQNSILWTASCWDVNSVAFMAKYDVPFLKVPSALITHADLLACYEGTGKPVVFSTGMSSMDEITACYNLLISRKTPVAIMHTTSTYPCPVAELNLRMIQTLARRFPVPIGYSGHEVGLATTIAAVAMGATMVERHITLDRAMWGSDQAASVEPVGLERLVRDIRAVESALGDGEKRVYASESPNRAKLRGTS